jgi:dephospho-CoA kinase
MPLVLGVTGSIATGKSYLCQYLVERYGAVHGDADKIVHRMFDPGREGYDNAIKEFGQEIVGEDGYIDRRKVGAIVFGNPDAMRRWTRAIGNIAEEIKGVIDQWRAELPQDQVAIMEAVNLIEAGYSAWCEQTWLVAADDAIALPRLIERNNFSEEEAKQRLASARDWKLRAPASDHVFHNDGTLEEFTAEIDRVYEAMMAQWREGTLPPSKYGPWREEQEAKRKAEEAAKAESPASSP